MDSREYSTLITLNAQGKKSHFKYIKRTFCMWFPFEGINQSYWSFHGVPRNYDGILNDRIHARTHTILNLFVTQWSCYPVNVHSSCLLTPWFSVFCSFFSGKFCVFLLQLWRLLCKKIDFILQSTRDFFFVTHLPSHTPDVSCMNGLDILLLNHTGYVLQHIFH